MNSINLNSKKSSVAILLATFNGENYIQIQLNSILNQDHTCWHIYASDDGSDDSTIKILEDFQVKYGENRITILNGPKKGPTTNFLSILRKIKINYDYYCFCDQDDYWHSNKLSHAIDIIINFNNQYPILYCGITRYVDSEGNFLTNSRIFNNKPTFKNALVQSIAGGNTMIFNHNSAKLLYKTPYCHNLIAHDWWLYILVAAYDGIIYYDRSPFVDYRQHSSSLVGHNKSIISKMKRFTLAMAGKYKEYNDENLRILSEFNSDLSLQNKHTLYFFRMMKNGNIFQRLISFYKSRIRRQSLLDNFAIIILLVFKRV